MGKILEMGVSESTDEILDDGGEFFTNKKVKDSSIKPNGWKYKGKKWVTLACWLHSIWFIMGCVWVGIFDPIEYTPNIYYVSIMGGSLVVGIFCLIMGIGFWEFMKLPSGPG